MVGIKKIRARQIKYEDVYKLDVDKTPEENVLDIMQALYLRENQHFEGSPLNLQTASLSLRNEPQSRRVSYLNALVTLIAREGNTDNLGFTTEELMLCLRESLVDNSADVRGTALRVLRYLLQTESDVDIFNNLRIPYLVIRSLDLLPRNEIERAQAIRVIRRVVSLVGITLSTSTEKAKVDLGLLRCLVAIARSTGNGTEQGSGDRLARPCIATLAEIGILNPKMFIACDGVGAITRYLLECTTPNMSESLCGVLLHTLNNPSTRSQARVDLKCLAAPYNEFHSKQITDKVREEREKRFISSRLSLVCVLRSWPGALHFCNPNTHCGLKSLVHSLYLNHREVRRAILDLLYELLGIPQPEWTDEISVALAAVDPSDFQDCWRLNEGFVAAEGRAILPHLAATGPDIIEMHLALLLYCFLEAGLLDGLAEVIVSSDTFISVRATVLLGQLVQMCSSLVPRDAHVAAALAAHAAKANPNALRATSALHTVTRTRAVRPAAYSLFLDHVLHCCAGVYAEQEQKHKSTRPPHRHSFSSKDSAPQSFRVKSNSLSSRTSAVLEKLTQKTKLFITADKEKEALFKDSLVFQQRDGSQWDWGVIRAILKEDDGSSMLMLHENTDRIWTKAILSYLLPSNNKYSHGDLSSQHQETRAACQLLRILLKDTDGVKLLEEFFQDVNNQVRAILAARHAHDCLFSPQHVTNTNCQMYFLFIGQLCHTPTGLKLFHDSGLYKSLLELMPRKHCCYVKLIVSSLNYTIDSYPREILAQTLQMGSEESRLYATQFLNVLLRASQKSCDLIKKRSRLIKPTCRPLNGELERSGGKDMETWILELLIRRVQDESKTISKTALEILDEACHVPVYLDRLIKLRDTVSEICRINQSDVPKAPSDDKAYLFWLQLHIEAAVRSNSQDEFVARHLQFWRSFYDYRYVGNLESEWVKALRDNGNQGWSQGRASPPFHPFSALARHPRAVHVLKPHLVRHLECLKQNLFTTEQEIVDMKASLWSLGHSAKTAEGVDLLLNIGTHDDNAFSMIVNVAKFCPVYSLRATAFYSLGLVATNHKGANVLNELGWATIRHTRHERFPITVEDRGVQKEVCDEEPQASSSPLARHIVDIESSDPSSDHGIADSFIESRPSNVFSELNVHESSQFETLSSKRISSDDSDVLDGRPSHMASPSSHKKSQTLPQRNYNQHDRSLSESKTIDILRDNTIYEDAIHVGRIPESRLCLSESRVRNTSESSTSGVSSSYESVYGRYPYSDKILTLSPIPSSSSVIGMKSAPLRRTSLLSIPGLSSGSPTSASDFHGIATIRALQFHRRPHLSESCESEDVLRTKSFRRSTSKNRHTLSLLKYDWKPLEMMPEYGWEWNSINAKIRNSSKSTNQGYSVGQTPSLTYRGIALPQKLADLFPENEFGNVPMQPPSKEMTSSDTSLSIKGSTNTVSCMGVCGGGSCLQCVRAPGPSTAQLREAFISGSMENVRSGPHWYGSYGRSWSASLSRSHTPRSEQSALSGSAPLSHAILRHAANLANPLQTKVTKTYLLGLKQRHPEAFQSVCLYSEVSKALSESPYLMSSRRFLQELFLDLAFECFTAEAQQIITAKRCSAKPVT